MRTSNERGIALIMVLLVMMLMSALVVGFTAVVMSDQRFRGIDRDRTQAFYAAHSGLEKMTVDLRNLFVASVAPTAAQLTAIQAAPPVIGGITYQAADGSSGYTLTAQPPSPGPIQSGSSPWAGLTAVKTIYQMESTARTAVGGEVHLSRRLETVAIPVFQFGMFSDVDLSYFAGPNFGFGGRVHTNGNLFLAQGDGATLTLTDKVTALKQVVRQRLSNGVSIDASSSHTGAVSLRTAGAQRNLDRTEGSVLDDENSALNDAWPGISKNTYNSWLRNGPRNGVGGTGVTELRLPILNAVSPDPINPVSNIDLVKRPRVNENASNPSLLSERFYSKVSLRILLSDTAPDIMNLPGIVTANPPVALETNWTTTLPDNGTGITYGPISTTRPPTSLSPGPPLDVEIANPGTTLGATTINFKDPIPSSVKLPASFKYGAAVVTCTGHTGASAILVGCSGTPAIAAGIHVQLGLGALSDIGTGLIGGYIKIEMQNNAKVWKDVTIEILNFGISGPSLADPGGAGTPCGDPTPDAIVRLQRLRDNTDNVTGCNYQASIDPTDYWPNTLFDPREGLQRDTGAGTDVPLGGVMHYITIDVKNLASWFKGTATYAGGSGTNANNDGGAGFSVYFSDRRNNRDIASKETGEYGFEDTVNPGSAGGAPNGTLDVGEDVGGPGPIVPGGGNGLLEVYGSRPNYKGNFNTMVPGAVPPLDLTAGPRSPVAPSVAKANRAILFRHALKLIKGQDIKSAIPGLTIVTENPLYIEGDWNANSAGGGFADPHAATSFIADAVTLLSSSWNDNKSYAFPYGPGTGAGPGPTNRNRSQNFYRAAIIAGKGPSFPWPAGTANDFGTDGGAHNFLRYLEFGGQTVNYRGSLVTLYYSRQATGTFKCCTTVYGAPTRSYAFDLDFLDPALLPPLTPLLRDVNVLGFSQELRPGK